jgi:uncharacterized protein (DUF927 family)
VLRVARRFAIVAVAGELATHYGLTGWSEGQAGAAARRCLTSWLESFGGTGNREERAILSQVRCFFEMHGASRFQSKTASEDARIPNRAGFVETHDGERRYFVLPEVFRREMCQGFDARRAVAALRAAGWLEPGSDGKATQKPRLPGMGTVRCYVLNARMWEGDE